MKAGRSLAGPLGTVLITLREDPEGCWDCLVIADDMRPTGWGTFNYTAYWLERHCRPLWPEDASSAEER